MIVFQDPRLLEEAAGEGMEVKVKAGNLQKVVAL